MTKQDNLSAFITARLDPQLRGTLAALARLERVNTSEALRRAISLAGDICGCAGGGLLLGGGDGGQTQGGSDGQT